MQLLRNALFIQHYVDLGHVDLGRVDRLHDDDEDEDDDEKPNFSGLASGRGEGLMDEGSTTHHKERRNEDIALDLMKFVAMTTGYGKTTSSGVGFQGTGSAAKPDEYAAQLLELYGKCKAAVEGKK